MLIAMILAHLVGDYILQWNRLAQWKSRALEGVAVHCLIVLAVTWLFALPFDPQWWPWVLFIGGLHFVIDAGQLLWQPRLAPLARFTLDQSAHFGVIFVALAAGGVVDVEGITAVAATFLQDEQRLLYLLGYAFVTMPAWVMVKFVAYGLVNGSAPEFGGGDKYLGIFERLLMTTFVALGQFLLVPLVAVPRLVLERRQVVHSENTAVYLTELLASVSVAVGTGLLLGAL